MAIDVDVDVKASVSIGSIPTFPNPAPTIVLSAINRAEANPNYTSLAAMVKLGMHEIPSGSIRRDLLRQFALLTSDATSIKHLQEDIVRVIAGQLAIYNWVGFYMLDPSDPAILILGPFVGEPTTHVRISLAQGICGAAAATGKVIIVDDVGEDPRYLSCSLMTKSEIVVPIFADGSVIGEIDIDSHSPAAFGEVDKAFLEEAARIVGAYAETHSGREFAK